MPNYGDPEYWEKRYEEQQGRTFDWLESYESLSPLIKPVWPPDSKILILGCGNAELSEDLYKDGYRHISNIDISATVIAQMKERNAALPEMTWSVMDVRALDFPANTFDLAIDKSTIDALLCGDNSYMNVAKMTKEVQRVLNTGGTYMAISYGNPDSRLEHLQWRHLHWEISYVTMNEETQNPHFVYLCKKKEGADDVALENWKEVEEALYNEDQDDELCSDEDDQAKEE